MHLLIILTQFRPHGSAPVTEMQGQIVDNLVGVSGSMSTCRTVTLSLLSGALKSRLRQLKINEVAGRLRLSKESLPAADLCPVVGFVAARHFR